MYRRRGYPSRRRFYRRRAFRRPAKLARLDRRSNFLPEAQQVCFRWHTLCQDKQVGRGAPVEFITLRMLGMSDPNWRMDMASPPRLFDYWGDRYLHYVTWRTDVHWRWTWQPHPKASQAVFDPALIQNFMALVHLGENPMTLANAADWRDLSGAPGWKLYSIKPAMGYVANATGDGGVQVPVSKAWNSRVYHKSFKGYKHCGATNWKELVNTEYMGNMQGSTGSATCPKDDWSMRFWLAPDMWNTGMAEMYNSWTLQVWCQYYCTLFGRRKVFSDLAPMTNLYDPRYKDAGTADAAPSAPGFDPVIPIDTNTVFPS